MSTNRNIIAQANDDRTTTTSQMDQTPHRVLCSPDGDMSYTTSTQSNDHTREVHQSYEQFGEPIPNRAGAFYGSQDFVDTSRPSGPYVEDLSEGRPLDDLHISKISSQATKALNRDLMAAIGLTEEHRRHVARYVERRRACVEILNIWRLQGGNSTVRDVKNLLIRAGDNQPNKYSEMINDIVNSPP
ncbi:uncharacterized protein LOC143462487 [Clavelina lepadiformis]|uniref:uncharacterized protein LOC143462487 n=1 Tax=Clavelina lepadiformis TaxID=159417 RepID=UPI004041B193